MEPEDCGYATTDEELDSDDDGGVELDLKMWLSQLDAPASASSTTKISPAKSKRSTAVTTGAASRTLKTEQQQEIDFDSILGQFSSLDEQFNDFGDDQSSSSRPMPSKPSPKVMAKAPAPNSDAAAYREVKIADDFDDISSQLMDAIFELNQFVGGDVVVGSRDNAVLQSVEVKRAGVQPVVEVGQRHVVPSSGMNPPHLPQPLSIDAKKPLPEKVKTQKPPSAVPRTSAKHDVGNAEETVSLKSTDSGSSSGNLTQSVTSSRLSSRSTVSENLPQVCLKVFSPDGDSKSVLVDERTTVGQLCEMLTQKNFSDQNRSWGITEQIPDLFMQRFLEDHQPILEEIREWPKETNNRLAFLENPKKYDMFDKSQVLDESRWEPTGLEGWLHLKSDGKKAWKKWNCVLQNGGIFYNARGKGKTELSCVRRLDKVEVFTSVGWKKKFKAPTEFGFALKTPATQKKSAEDIKYLCADDQVTMFKWVTAIRVAKYGLQLYRNFRQSLCPPENGSMPAGVNELTAPAALRRESTNRLNAGTAHRVSNLTEDPAMSSEFDNYSTTSSQRRGSGDSTRSGSITESVPCGSKMKAQIPITAQTARLLSMQPSSTVQTLPRSTSRRESQKTPSVNTTHERRVYAEANPAVHQTGMEINSSRFRPESPDLPPPPPELLAFQEERPPLPLTPGRGPSRQKVGPPAPPRRDEATKLSFKAKGNNNNAQTKNFILNLQRAIGQKCQHGAEGMIQLDMPLPPPPVYSDEPSYLDLGDLPPPPAELLEELKFMKRKSHQPPPTPVKYANVRASKIH